MSLSRSLQYAFIAIIVTTVGFSLYQWNASRASTQKTAPNNGLVGYWSFNEGTGTLAGDSSVNKNTGTLTNGPTWGTGKFGSAITFDGTDDYVSATNVGNVQTISYWIKSNNQANGGIELNSEQYITDNAIPEGFANSTVYIDGVLQSSLYGSELVTNGNMESAGNWSSWGAPISQAQSSDTAHSGTYSRKVVTNPVYYEGIYQNIAGLSGSTQYKMSFWQYGSSGIDSYGILNVNGSDAFTFGFGTPTNIWQYYKGYGTTPSSITTARVMMLSEHDAMTRYFDDVSLKQVLTRYPLTDTTKWHHIVITTTTAVNASAVKIGKGGATYFSGSLDEVRIYNRALSGTEVTNLYNLGAAKLNTSPTASLTSGLVGYWTFDGKDTPWSSSSAGTATDRSGNSNTGTLTNMSRATSSVSGKLGQALNFDGVNDFVTLSNLAYTGATSLSAWIYPNTLSGRQVIVGRFDGGSSFPWSYGYGMVLESNCLHGISSNNYWGWYNNLCAAVQQGVWQHVVFTITGSSGTQTGSLYVDGVLRSSYAGTADPYSLYGPAIGYGEGNADGGYFNGKIDDVRSYNRALSAGEIQSLYDLGASDKVNSSVSQNQGTGRLDSGLVGYWPLDDGSGTNANDASTNNNDGTLTGGPTWGTGRIGGDVVFDGVNDYIDLGNRSVLNLTNDFTVSQWVKINNITQSDYKRFFGRAQIDDNNRPFYTEYNHLTNKYSAVWRNGGTFGGNSGKTVTSTQWHHFVVTFKDGKSKSYSDGVLIESSSGVVQPPSSSSNTGIGDIFSGYYFPGSIDEVRVYNRVLSDDEVSQLYRLTTPTGVDTSLKGYWSFNGKDTNWTSSSAGTVADLSGSGNTGTMTNMSRATSSVSGKIGQALNFDGVDDYVNAGGSSNFTSSDFSISYWMKLNSLSTNVGGQGPVPIYKGQFNTNGYYAQIQQNGAVGFFTCQSGATQSTGTAAGTIVTGRWYHIVHTRGGSSVRNYVDGVDQTTGPATHINPTSSGSNFMIGRYGDSGTIIYTNGIIDEVRTYSRALSAPEITALYNSGR